jgi:hypothetical protein
MRNCIKWLGSNNNNYQWFEAEMKQDRYKWGIQIYYSIFAISSDTKTYNYTKKIALL